MRPTVISLLLIGLCAGVSTLAIAQNVTAGDQPNAHAQNKATPDVDSAKAKPGMNADETAVPAADSAAGKPAMTEDEAKPAKSDTANAQVWKDQYTAAKDKAQATYKDAKTTCGSLESGAKGKCMKNARSARTEALALAKSQWDSHIKMDGRPARPTKGDLDKPTTEATNTQ